MVTIVHFFGHKHTITAIHEPKYETRMNQNAEVECVLVGGSSRSGEVIYHEPLRTKMTPDQRVGSPGVKLTKTPSGQACLRPALIRENEY